jgi:ProP effector
MPDLPELPSLPQALESPALPPVPAPTLAQAPEPEPEPKHAVEAASDAPADAASEHRSEDKGPANLSPAACANLLGQHFPALFAAGRALPIKLRIQADIQARLPGLFSKKSLSIFLHRYTTSTAYLKALAAAPQRLDLDGAPAGEVAEEHRLAASQEVERRRALFDERRANERELANEARRAAAEQARKQQAAQQAARHAAHHSAEAEARRQRAGLLRAFETTTLTAGNFCALKGLVEADLQAQLSLARQEREQRPPEPPPQRAAQRPADARAGRRDEQGPRGPRGPHGPHGPRGPRRPHAPDEGGSGPAKPGGKAGGRPPR